ncbi:MAG TPA: hypothetical protein VLN59_07170 [Burkholderiales bacterium]|nr:hypothetical protein [Burkholderiales bacterium]
MQTQERDRIVKTYYDPELNPVACVAKCVAGIAIVGLVGIVGVELNQSGAEKLTDVARVEVRQLQAVEAPRQQEMAIREAQ